jgi:hypothetical protein
MIAFLLIIWDNFGAEEFEQAAFNELTWQALGT